MRDDPDVKAKMSEMNEEKRTKLREIEVLYLFIFFESAPFGAFHKAVVYFSLLFLIGDSGEGHEVPG